MRAGFGQRRKMLRRSLDGLVTPEQFEAAGVAPTARPEELDCSRVVPARRRRCSSPRRHPMSTLRAHAKLTLSLRVTGVRDDGYHLIDAEMVSLELHDLLTFDAVRARTEPALTAIGPFADGVPTRRHEPRRAGARPRRIARRHVTIDKRIPHGGGLGGGSTDAATALRWAGFGTSRSRTRRAGRLGADIPFCLVGGRARVSGIGEIVEPLPHVDRTVTLDHPAAARQHAGGLPRVGRARPSGRTATRGTTSRPRRSSSSPSWRDGATGFAERIGPRSDARRQRRDVVRRGIARSASSPTSAALGATVHRS